MSPEKQAALEKAHEALSTKHAAERETRRLPDGYKDTNALLDAIDLRCSEHPRGLAGVAAEMRVPRRSLQRWLDATKMPSTASMRKMDLVVRSPLPTPLRSQILHGIPVLSRKQSMPANQWRTILENWKVGDCVDVAYSRAYLLGVAAKSRKQKAITRKLNNRTARVWRVK